MKDTVYKRYKLELATHDLSGYREHLRRAAVSVNGNPKNNAFAKDLANNTRHQLDISQFPLSGNIYASLKRDRSRHNNFAPFTEINPLRDHRGRYFVYTARRWWLVTVEPK